MEKNIENLDEHSAIKLSKELNILDLKEENELAFKFSDYIMFSPFGMLLIENSIKSLRKKYSQVKFSIKVNKESRSITYAAHMGFFKAISENINFGKLPGEALGNDNYIPISRIHFKNYRSNYLFSKMSPLKYIEYEARNLAKVLAQKNEELEKLFTYLIREIIRNSQEHGLTDMAWVCAQNWKSRSTAEIAILDNGIGYKESLIRKYKKFVINDETAMRIALEPGVTESYVSKYAQEEENSGFGLFVASEICDALDGSFSILSGNTLLKKHKGTFSIMEAFHEGSIIKMSINTSKNFCFEELIANIVTDGEKMIRQNKKASELSKGKFLIS